MAIPKSIFDVPRSKEDLVSANQGMSNLYYDEISSLRSIIDSGNNSNNFGKGLISFRWHPASGSWWIPSRSYFRIDCALSKPNGEIPLAVNDNIAPNMGLASCLFSKMQYKINDKTISEISEHCPQIDACKTRLNRTGQWMKTTGDNLNMWESDFNKRKQKILSNGIDYDNLILRNFEEPAAATSGNRLDFLDLATPNQVQFVTATDEIRFTANGGTAIPDLAQYFSIGETLYFNDGAERNLAITGFLSTVTTNDTIVVTNVNANVAAADLVSQVRISKKVTDIINSKDRRVIKFSLIYQPPLSIFGINHAIAGSSKHEIDLIPFSETVYQKNAIESILADKVHTTDGANNNFRFKVENMLFYAARCDGPIIEKDEHILDLEETRLQITQITSNSRSQYSLDVSPSSHAFTVAFQDESAETDTQYSQSKFKIRNNEELNLTNMYIRYGGLQKPQPDYRPLLQEGESGNANRYTDRMVEQYARSIMYNGAYYDSSYETLKEYYFGRGLYLHFPYNKTGSDRETRVYVSTEFSSLTGQPRLLLFNHFKKAVILKYENGTLSEVIINEV